ncbi:MAG: Slp family lipoprotein [Desulfuromonadales bacterium]|nr:Slp family lipoprotein [Desulfuromonadales bacterium]
MKRYWLLPLMFFLLIGGCARVPLPEEALSRADPSLFFAEIKANPQAYQGRTLLLGGQVLENRSTSAGTTLEILNYDLDRSGRPQEIDESGGRFLVRAERFLDPELYAKGKYVTLTATVIGQEIRPLQSFDYTYPVFRLEAIHLWRDPVFYDAPGYPYPYSPFYYDPFWYPYAPPFYRDPFWHHRRPWYW